MLPFETIWMHLEGIVPSDISPKEKDKNHIMSLTWNIKQKAINELTKINSEIQITQWWLPKGKVGGRLGELGKGGHIDGNRKEVEYTDTEL